ncbi:FimV/HubP family polar landmark protein [Litoribacillus peritrichatus]|uniref:FimV/HubP family polar landmark protein n=1 Tax=Litoribacillus peritrichatus TaxID=718191 RepID=A0ABP7M3R0_9GAMM
MKLRKLTSALVAAGVLTSPFALGLGLGDLKLKSALNQPLQAEIQLLQTRELVTEEILPSMASEEEFDRAGVERFFFLSDISFDVELTGNGKGSLLLTTKQSIQEPFLNFLVEVNWPTGRVLREYTVLLDPPVYEDEAPGIVVTPTRTTAQPESQVSVTPVRQSAPQRNSSATVTPSASTYEGGDTRTVGASDTLWDIATEVRPSRSVTIQQTMMAIRELNPNAFVAGNINKIKKGSVLRVPTLDQVENWQHGSAVEEVAAHNKRYKDSITPGSDSTSQVQLSAVDQQVQSEVQAPESARLKIVRSDVSASSGGSASGDESSSSNVESLQNELAITQENLDKASRENEKLNSKLASLEEQVEKLSRLVTLKDTQMAELQTGMAMSGEDPADAMVDEVATDSEVMGESPAMAESTDGAESELSAEIDGAEVDGADIANEEGIAGEVEQPSVALEEPGVAEVIEEPVVAEVPPPADKPIVKPEVDAVGVTAPKQPSLFESITGNPIWLVAIGAGSLFFVILLFMLSRRSYQRESELSDVLEQENKADQQSSDVQAEMDNIEQELDGLDLESQGFGQVSLDSEDAMQPDDIVARADSFIAYGQFDNAVVLLNEAINKEAGRVDLRLKMLEVYSEMQDSQGFARQKQEILGLGADDVLAQIEVLEQKLPGYMGEASVNAFDSNESLVGGKPLMGDADFDLSSGNKEDDEFSYSLEDLESELASDLSGDVAPASDALDDLDFNLEEELGITDDAVSEASLDEESAGDEFSLDMEVDGALDASEVDALDDLNLDDLDTDLGDAGAGIGLDLEGDSSSAAQEPVELDSGLELDEVADELDSFELPATEDNVLSEFDMGDDVSEDSIQDESIIEPELDEISLDSETQTETASAELSQDELGEVLDVGVDLEDLAKSLGVDSVDEVDLDAELASATDVPVVAAEPAKPAVDEQEAQEDLSLDVDVTSEPTASSDDLPSLDMAEEVDTSVAEEVSQDVNEIPAAAATLDESVGSGLAEDELDFFVGTDEVATKLDLARAYVDMGDVDGARDILEEVVLEGSEEQKSEAGDLLNSLS